MKKALLSIALAVCGIAFADTYNTVLHARISPTNRVVTSIPTWAQSATPPKSGADTNEVNALIAKYNETNLTTRINAKQDTLVSGTNIKTVNNQSLLGSGNIEIQGGGGSDDMLILTNDVVKTKSGTQITASNVGARSSTDQSFTNLHIDNGYGRSFRLGSDFSGYLPGFLVYSWNQIKRKIGGAGQSDETLTDYIDSRADSRIETQVPSWSLEPTKPTYTYAEVGAVGSNQYWTVKKGSEAGVGVRRASSGIGSSLFVGCNSFGTIDQGGHWQYSNGGYEDFFNGSVLRMLTGSQLWWLTGAKPWLQTAENFRIGGNAYSGGTALPTWVDNRITTAVPAWARNSTKPSYEASEVGAVPTTRKVNNKALSSDITLQPSDIGAASTQDLEATQAIVYSWEQFLDGSNVVFSITNYISGSYNLDTAKFRILEMTNGFYREVYNSRNEIVMHIDNFKTNDFRVATNQVITSVDTKIAGKADKAWGKYTSTGSDVIDVYASNTVYMTEPTTVFAGGTEYARFAVGEGSICILTTKGAPVYTAGEEGTFKFQDNGGTNYFGFARSDSYTIGANASGITVNNQMVTITYDLVSGVTPCIWYMESLENYDPTAWEQLNLPTGEPIPGASHVVSWEPNPPEGKRICYINVTGEAKGFFRATIEVAGSAKFITNMPADLTAGIVCTNTATGVNGVIVPSYNGSSVIWTWRAN